MKSRTEVLTRDRISFPSLFFLSWYNPTFLCNIFPLTTFCVVLNLSFITFHRMLLRLDCFVNYLLLAPLVMSTHTRVEMFSWRPLFNNKHIIIIIIILVHAFTLVLLKNYCFPRTQDTRRKKRKQNVSASMAILASNR